MVYRIYVEKKKELANEARTLFDDVKTFLGIENIDAVRIVNCYDAENIDAELFENCKRTVFSEPQLDIITDETNFDGAYVFAVEYLPGQFDQRADSAAQCIQIISQGERPLIKTMKVYALYGDLKDEEIEKIKKYVINPVEAREASLLKPETIKMEYEIPTEVETLDGFIDLDRVGLEEFIAKKGLAMDIDDIAFVQEYFKGEKRNPTITEIKVIDTYWSDHCRHTTFLTIIDSVEFEDKLVQSVYEEYIADRVALGITKPVTLMNIATLAVKVLSKQGKLDKLDKSEEINACSIKIDVDINGTMEKWLLMFKNETHNHPTEIEPFGGAATCIGGAIRDPLSGRSYVYGAMRLTGAGNPLKPISETIEGKLPQRKIVTTAAAGYASYGNQIGLATGIVDEVYHSGYVAKRMEVGAVIAAAPEKNIRRERPVDSDIVILLGGRTGRDGCGGATGSSKSHNLMSLENCGAEVQKGNAPEERKLQRLFRNPEASGLIKRCNDFGAGGVSVAIGELADGLEINLNAVLKKYDGLDGTELAISESQERMAVVVAKEDVEKFMALAESENLEASVVAQIKENPHLIIKWNGKNIVDISREFLDSNGAEKHITAANKVGSDWEKDTTGSFVDLYRHAAANLNVCSKRGLSERFDSTIGAGTVLMPFGGKNQMTPVQSMVQKIPVEKGDTTTCSLMSWGFNPYISDRSPFHGAYLAVVESVSKLVASGAYFSDVYLSFQEYFERLESDPERWGKPLTALLGAYKAQKDLGIAAIGGKDSMSGTFEHIHVPPTLISFAVTTADIKYIISGEFKKAGHKVVVLRPETNEHGLPKADSLRQVFEIVSLLIAENKVCAAYAIGFGGVAEAVLKMSVGNGLGFKFENTVSKHHIFEYIYGGFVLELTDDTNIGITIGYTTIDKEITYKCDTLLLSELEKLYEDKLESVYSSNIKSDNKVIPKFEYKATSYPMPLMKTAKPKVLIPVFPGTNCEYDSARAVDTAGAKAEIFVINNLSPMAIAESVRSFAKKVDESQIIFIPGGFSGGDEPDGSGKFITAFFRNEAVKETVTKLLEDRDGLMCGICNGFQALIKLGLVPYGKIIDTDESCPTLTFNTIGRHQSKIVHTRIASNKSPWLMHTNVNDIYTVPISHGEGRFIASDDVIRQLAGNGQIATQYVDLNGMPTDDIRYNPNNSACAIEGITSPDGRIFGKMGHSERWNNGLYKNVEGNYDIGMFKSAVEYYK
ncbi:MAG: phosphoribosylformylglycinamidine synthase [Candidatus Metalachnospira sp.]|nr:phosphoribosylformylglycinamidine synthase [Candidatus Metalachnospira sp.]